jgi:hypothetical protein
MGHYSRECLNLLALITKNNMGSSSQRFFVEEKGKTQVHLIEPMLWPKLNNWQKTLLIFTQVLRGSRRMVKPQNKREKIEGKGLDFKTF